MQPPHKADLSNPDLTILVSVVKNVCAIGVASHFRELGKYNLRELCNEPDANQEAAAPANVAEGGKAEAKPETVVEDPGKVEAAVAEQNESKDGVAETAA
jgi:hypothetical protein